MVLSGKGFPEGDFLKIENWGCLTMPPLLKNFIMRYVLFLLLLIPSISWGQCKVRFINKTDSIINVHFSGLGINVTLKGKDTSVYYPVQSMIGREPYIISFEGDQFQSEAGKDKTPITSGNWEIIFRWSTISNSWRSLMSQVVE